MAIGINLSDEGNYYPRRRKINLDMDGVLCDFDLAALRLFGKLFSEFESSQEAWGAMSCHQDIYALLEPMQDADFLVQEVQKLALACNCDVGVLTAVPRTRAFPRAEQDKRDWIKRHYPALLPRFAIGPFAIEKQNHCEPGDVLIDDNRQNITQWYSKQGHGIYHINARLSIEQLRQYLLQDRS